jgi:hypothetical protein
VAISVNRANILKSKARKISPEIPVVVGVLAVCFSAALILTSRDSGSLVYYGDAVSHLVIPRLVFDSVTPDLPQFGTVLPITHIMMLPFVASDFLFHTGLAGTLVSAFSFFLLLYRITKIEFSSTPAALYVKNISYNPAMEYFKKPAIFYGSYLVREKNNE